MMTGLKSESASQVNYRVILFVLRGDYIQDIKDITDNISERDCSIKIKSTISSIHLY